jgi:hypothetical protein
MKEVYSIWRLLDLEISPEDPPILSHSPTIWRLLDLEVSPEEPQRLKVLDAYTRESIY